MDSSITEKNSVAEKKVHPLPPTYAFTPGRHALPAQIKMSELQASLTSAEAAHAAAQSTIVSVTTDRDDLKEAVTTLRRRIRDLETAVARSGTEVRVADDAGPSLSVLWPTMTAGYCPCFVC